MKCSAAEFAGMYEKIYQDLYRFALCMMKNTHDAEDAVSDAVIRGYEHISSLREADAFKSWMFTILANTCKKKLKTAALAATVESDEQVGEHIESRREDLELRIDLRRAFAMLSEEEQMIVGLSVFGGYQSKEIGEVLKMKDGTVRSKRSRALEKMSAALNAPEAAGRS